MRTVMLGATGLEVTPLAYGTWQFGGDWGPVDERAAMAAIGHARSLGINFFDTAQAYGFGRSERLLGQALAADLRAARDSVVIATKGGLRMDGENLVRDASPAWLRKGAEASLDALGTDYIDLYQVHWPDPQTPIGETAAALAELIREGLIRHVGVSNYSPGQIEQFATVLPVETIQQPYHLFRRDIEADLLPYAAARGIGVLAYGPLAHGLLGGAITGATTFTAGDWRSHSPAFTGDGFARNLQVVAALRAFATRRGATIGQLAVAWVLAHAAVQVAIVGARTPAHLAESLGALDLTLSQADLAEIDHIMAAAVPGRRPHPGRNVMTTTQPTARKITPGRPGHSDGTATPAIAFLGTGRMGAPMAANLARSGLAVRVWNRTASRAAALTTDGATVASSPADAVQGAGILITTLADGPATEQVWNGPDGLLTTPPGLIWVQMATVGMEWTERFAATAAGHGVRFVDAPVSGSQGPAQAGQLTILASGPDGLRDILAPVFAALGRATAWLGPAGNGTKAKLVLNNWLADLTETTAETLSFARQLGLDPAGIVDLLASTPLGSPYAVQKAHSMLAGDFTPAFALKLALKDAELAAQAAEASGSRLTLTGALLPRWRDAAASGHADEDLAAIYTTPDQPGRPGPGRDRRPHRRRARRAARAGRPFLPGALRQLLPGAAGTGITYLIGHLAGTTG